MSRTVKVLGTEANLSTASTVGDAGLVRVHNTTAGVVLITRADGVGTIGTASMQANTVEYFVKAPSETFAANAIVLAASVAFTN